MPRLLDTLFLKQLQCGPTLNLMVAVLVESGNINKVGDSESDTLQTRTVAVDNKVEFFLKFKLIENDNTLDMYINVKKINTIENSLVGVNINYKNFKKYVQCSNNSIELCLDNGVRSYRLFYTFILFQFEITITVKEVSLSMNNKLYEDTDFTDFELQASDGSVAVHKAILSVHSDMFKTMLKGEWKETAEGRVNIDGVTVQTLRHLKDYMYLGTLPGADEGLKPLLLLAEHYLMVKLKSDCIDKLVASVEPKNFEDILQFACQGSPSTDLVRALIFQVPDYIRGNKTLSLSTNNSR